MHFRFFSMMTRGLATVALASLFATSAALHAQQAARIAPSSVVISTDQDSHLVSPAQLDRQLQDSTATQQKQIHALTQFLSTPQAEKAMKDARIDPEQVRTAIPSLSATELAELSARADRAQHDFAAGVINNQTLLIIILVLVAVILIAVIR